METNLGYEAAQFERDCALPPEGGEAAVCDWCACCGGALLRGETVCVLRGMAYCLCCVRGGMEPAG